MKRRERAEELLTRELDGEITAAEREEFEQLLAADPALAEDIRQERELAGMLRAEANRYAPAGLADAVRAELHNEKVQELLRDDTATPRRWRRGMFSYAAAAAILIAAGVSYLMERRDTDSPVPMVSDAVVPAERRPAEVATMSEAPARISRDGRGRDEELPAARRSMTLMDDAGTEAETLMGDTVSRGDIYRYRQEPGTLAMEAIPEADDAAPAGAREFRLREAEPAPAFDAMTFGAYSDPAPFPALESAEQAEELLTQARAQVLIDTPWQSAAEGFLEGRPDVERNTQIPGLRFMVVELDDASQAVDFERSFRSQAQLPLPPSQMQTVRERPRAMIAYRQDMPAAPAMAIEADTAVASREVTRAGTREALRTLAESHQGRMLFVADELTETLGTPRPAVSEWRMTLDAPAPPRQQFAVLEFENAGQARKALLEIPRRTQDSTLPGESMAAELIRVHGTTRLIVPLAVENRERPPE